MRRLRSAKTLSLAGLVLLGLAAVMLSLAALTRFGGTEAEPAPTTDGAAATAPSSASPTPSPSPTASVSASPETVTPLPVPDGPKAVIVGDSYSVEGSDAWIGEAAAELAWGEVVNLSSPGRGYITVPRECGFEPCATFEGTIPVIVAAEPDIVVTFGGTADGDYSLRDSSSEYFAALRASLPATELVALNPVTTGDDAPYWLDMHLQTIWASVEAVNGTFVDVGQPGLGDGESLSADAHTAIAESVIRTLS